MKRLVLAITLFALFAAGRISAQEPTGESPLDQNVLPAPTQEMWFYLQETRRYDNPQIMIRRREEKKAEQRRMRMAALKWFGFSASRPVANPVPFYGTAAPSWVGNGRDPYQWVGAGLRTAVRIEINENR